MIKETTFILRLKKIFSLLQEKVSFLQSKFPQTLFFLLFGFLFGNFFATFLFFFRVFFFWDGFIVAFLILWYEILNWLLYEKNTTKFSFIFSFFLKLFNYFKIGFFFGFFVDAFKVGS